MKFGEKISFNLDMTKSLTRSAGVTAERPATKMRAASIIRPGQLGVQETAVPEPNPDEVLVRLEGCGVCASNLPVWEGQPWFQYPYAPGAPGHEGWGRIERTGSNVRDLQIGDRVAMLSAHAYAEYDTASADGVVKLPASFDGQPFPGEALGCAMNIFRRCEITAGQSVAIVGTGFLGLLLTRLAAKAGARMVIAVSRRGFALDVARDCGATETVEMDDHWRIIERVKSLTENLGCERVIEATGKQWPLDLAGELAGERGRLIIAGYHQDGPRQVNMQLWNWRGLDVINAHERNPKVYVDGMRAAVEAVESGAIDPTPLYTHRFALEELASAFEIMRERPAGFVKALINLS